MSHHTTTEDVERQGKHREEFRTSPASTITLCVRVVPYDQWMRISVSPATSIGSLKDQVLLRARIGARRPSRSPQRSASSRQRKEPSARLKNDWDLLCPPPESMSSLSYAATSNMPPSFLARAPNPLTALLPISESAATTSPLASASRIHESREILRGDPGGGGPGSLPFFGIDRHGRMWTPAVSSSSGDLWTVSPAPSQSPDLCSSVSSDGTHGTDREGLIRRSSANEILATETGNVRLPHGPSSSRVVSASSKESGMPSLANRPRTRASMSSLAMVVSHQSQQRSTSNSGTFPRQFRSPQETMMQLSQAVGSLSPKPSSRRLNDDSATDGDRNDTQVSATPFSDSHVYTPLSASGLGFLTGNEDALLKEQEARRALKAAQADMRRAMKDIKVTASGGDSEESSHSETDLDAAKEVVTALSDSSFDRPYSEFSTSRNRGARGSRRNRSGTVTAPELSRGLTLMELANSTMSEKAVPMTNLTLDTVDAQVFSGRLAGVNKNEISQFEGSAHPHAAQWALMSFSSGFLLDNHLTVAALRLRPFELLEMQPARLQDRIRLPRCKVPASQAQLDLCDSTYATPYAQGYIYIFLAAAERGGVGPWERRYCVLIGKRLIVFAQIPSRQTLAQAVAHGSAPRKDAARRHRNGEGPADVLSEFDLEATVWIGSERADGRTLPRLPGTPSSDLLSVAFGRPGQTDGTSVPGLNATEEHIVSFRFDCDHEAYAWYKIFQRAHIQGTLARQLGSLTVGEVDRLLRRMLPSRAISEKQDRVERFRRLDDAGFGSSNGLYESRVSVSVDQWRHTCLRRALVAGRGGVVLPGQIGRPESKERRAQFPTNSEGQGRNALVRSRLRPHAYKVSVDDADMWSDWDEDEDFLCLGEFTEPAQSFSEGHRSASGGHRVVDTVAGGLISTSSGAFDRRRRILLRGRPMTSDAQPTSRRHTDAQTTQSLPASAASSPQMAASAGHSRKGPPWSIFRERTSKGHD
ncbi:unnamed protein product [Parajaminaea phylloscopi]